MKRGTVLLALAAAMSSCDRRNPAEDAASLNPAASFYASVHGRFESGHYYKPSPHAPVPGDSGAFILAPLLVVRASEHGGEPEFALPGEDGALRPSEPAMLVSAGSEHLNGVEHLQATYTWWMRPGSSGVFRRQAVRITLDGDGLPRLWEVEEDPTGYRVLYASQAWEDRARRQHGEPAAGRLHAIEAAWEDAPGTVVARIMTDSPVPIGPWIYQERDGRVATVLCRCMPSQIGSLRDGVLYRIVPAMPAGSRASSELENASMAAGDPRGLGLQQILRLPRP